VFRPEVKMTLKQYFFSKKSSWKHRVKCYGLVKFICWPLWSRIKKKKKKRGGGTAHFSLWDLNILSLVPPLVDKRSEARHRAFQWTHRVVGKHGATCSAITIGASRAETEGCTRHLARNLYNVMTRDLRITNFANNLIRCSKSFVVQRIIRWTANKRIQRISRE